MTARTNEENAVYYAQAVGDSITRYKTLAYVYVALAFLAVLKEWVNKTRG